MIHANNDPIVHDKDYTGLYIVIILLEVYGIVHVIL